MADPGDASVEARLQYLIDKDEIADVLARYLRGVDRCDAELIASAYHPDAVDEHSYQRMTGAEIGPFLAERMRTNYRATLHCVLNWRVRIEGDVAHAETYFAAWMLREEEGHQWIDQPAGRYVDRFERRNGEWRIAHRVVLPELAGRIDKTVPDLIKHLEHRPQRDRTDISYSSLDG